jgi:threonine aldolase
VKFVKFYSDNTGPVADELIKAVVDVNRGVTPAYGEDQLTSRLQQRFREIFEHDHLLVALTSSGTAANGIALALAAPPYSGIFCHETAHIYLAEPGTAEFFTGGARLLPVGGAGTKIAPDRLSTAIEKFCGASNMRLQPGVVSLTQATDAGAVYRPFEIQTLAAIANAHKMPVHVDGARFANALVQVGCSPAELTWKCGVDVMSFGVTKNGGMAFDAVVIFQPAIGQSLPKLLRRTGQLFSKMRYPASQALAYLNDGLWLRLAGQANEVARHLAARLGELPGVEITMPVESNMVLIRLQGRLADALRERGFNMIRKSDGSHRLVCQPDTTERELSEMIEVFAETSRIESERSVAAGHR